MMGSAPKSEGRRGSQGQLAAGRLSGYSPTIAVRGSDEKEESGPTATTQSWSGSGAGYTSTLRVAPTILPTEGDSLLKKLFVMRETGAVT
jgi:hypothetical protein